MPTFEPLSPSSEPLTNYPPVEQWDDWTEYDPAAWPRKVEKKYMLIPTVAASLSLPPVEWTRCG